jgi:hypothetical protein
MMKIRMKTWIPGLLFATALFFGAGYLTGNGAAAMAAPGATPAKGSLTDQVNRALAGTPN